MEKSYQNLVRFQGQIFGKKNYMDKVVIKLRIGQGKIISFPQVELKNDLYFIGKRLKQGDNIFVECAVETRFKEQKNFNHKREVQVFIANKIAYADNMLSDEILKEINSSYVTPINEFFIMGNLVRTRKISDKCVKIWVRTKDAKGKDNKINISTFFFVDNADGFIKKFEKDDAIFLIGSVETQNKIIREQKQYIQNLTIKEMRKVS